MDGGGVEALQHANTMQEGGPEMRQQLQLQLKPRLQLKLHPQLHHKPKPKSAPTSVRQWEPVPLRANGQMAPVAPGPAPMAGSGMAERRQKPRRDERVPLPNKMEWEIASAINRALLQQTAPAHIQIMNANRNARGTSTAITQQNVTSAMALIDRDVIITTARTVDKGVFNVEENESWERLHIHAVPLMRNMQKGTEGLQTMRDEIQTENEWVAVQMPVPWLGSPHSIQQRSQKWEISELSEVFIVKKSKVARGLLKEGVKAAGVWYQVAPFMNIGPDTRCMHRGVWGRPESMGSGKPGCGYCSGLHRTSDPKCIVVGCTAQQGALCGHTQEKCPNCRGNLIAFSSRCTKKTEVTGAAWEKCRR